MHVEQESSAAFACVETLLALQDYFQDRAAQRQIEDLIVQCEKCPWKGKRREFEVTHVNHKRLSIMFLNVTFFVTLF